MAGIEVGDIGFRAKFIADAESVKQVNNAISGLKSAAGKVLGMIGVGFSLKALNSMVEQYRSINLSLDSALEDIEDLQTAQKKISESADDSHTSYDLMAKSVETLLKANKELFDVDKAAKFTSVMTKLTKLSGGNDTDAQAVMSSMTNSIKSGRMDSGVMDTLFQKAPEAAKMLADYYGVTEKRLKQLASVGIIKMQDVTNVFLQNADEIDQKFSGIGMTTSEVISMIRSKFGLFVAVTNDMFQITQTAAKFIVRMGDTILRGLEKIRSMVVWVQEKVGGINNLAKLLAIIAGSVYVAIQFPKIISGIKTVAGLLKPANLKLALIIAVLTAIGLVIEDIVGFIQGKNSLLGTLLEKDGVDVDEFRENLIKSWENIKKATKALLTGIYNFFAPVIAKIKQLAEGLVQSLIGSIPGLSEFIAKLGGDEVDTQAWEQLGEVIGGVIAVILALVTAHKLATAAQTVLNAVMNANPISLVIAGIVALIAIIVLLVKNWDKVKEAMQAVWDKMKEVFGNIAEWFKSNVIDPIVGFFTGLWDSITGIVDKITEGVSNAFSTAFEWITSLPEKALTWGSDIVGGIVTGIKNAVNTVGDAVGEVADKIKSFLGFSEPEDGPLSDFHTYMPDMIESMSRGIRGGKAKIAEALTVITGEIKGALGEDGYENIVGDLSSIARAKKVSVGTASNAVQNSTTNSRVVNQNIEINNEFNGDRAGQEKSATAMKKATSDVSGELTRAFLFGY